MKIRLGQPVEKEDYFPREEIVDEIKNLLLGGENILIASPRRTGKTSILKHIENCPPEGYEPVYMYVGHIDSEEKYFEQLFKAVVSSGSFSKREQKLIKGWNWAKHCFDDITINVGGAGIDINTKARNVYTETFIDLIRNSKLDKKILLLIDEFPITVSKIIEKEGAHNATMFLEVNRRLRVESEISSKVQVIYTGSIGLRHVVKGINASDSINDLIKVEVTPLIIDDARELVRLLLNGKGSEIEDSVLDYMLETKIQWCIPYFIQHYCYQLTKHYKKTIIDSNEQIDLVESHLVSQIDTNLDNYDDRLKRYFKDERRKFAKAVLDHVCEKDSISREEIINLSNNPKHKIEDWKNVVSILQYDGYINNVGTPNQYRFNSPILKLWWYEFAR